MVLNLSVNTFILLCSSEPEASIIVFSFNLCGLGLIFKAWAM